MNKIRFARTALFIVIGILLLWMVQAVLSHKWVYPVDYSDRHDTFAEYYNITADTDVQALFIGSSHVYNSIDPMGIYKKAGITAYSLSTAAQPVEVSRYVLEDALSKIKPSVVFLDVSLLLREGKSSSWYRLVLDNMRLNTAKVNLAAAYTRFFEESNKTDAFVSALFPLLQYHTRWSELAKIDFSINRRLNYQWKGFNPTVTSVSAILDVDLMNNVDDKLQNKEIQTDDEDENVENHTNEENTEGLELPRENIELLLEMKKMCDEANVDFRLFKVPSLNFSQYYTGAWTLSKSQSIKKVSEEYGIPFLDLMYDVDLALDWNTDSCDGGQHLNILGAKKITNYMVDYMRQECGVQPAVNRHYEEDMPSYEDVMEKANLLITSDFPSYLEALSKQNDICVFFSVYQDMKNLLKPEGIAALNAFGLKTDFTALKGASPYLAIVDGGKVVYEASSNMQLEKKDALEDGTSYRLLSSGYYAGKKSSIQIKGQEYCLNKTGLNIVVYHKISKKILDSVCFNITASGYQQAIRNASENYIREYDMWRRRENYKQGIR